MKRLLIIDESKKQWYGYYGYNGYHYYKLTGNEKEYVEDKSSAQELSKLKEENQKLKAGNNKSIEDMENLKVNHEKDLKNLRVEHQKQLETTMKNTESFITSQYESKINSLKKEHEEEKKKIDAFNEEKLKEVQCELQNEQNRFKEKVNDNLKKDPTSNPRFEELSNIYKELSDNGIYDLVDCIKKVYKDLEDSELYQFLLQYLIVQGYEKLDSFKEKMDISVPENLQKLSDCLRRSLSQDLQEKFKVEFNNIKFDLKNYVKLVFEIENSVPSVKFINPSNPSKVKFNSLEHELESGSIKLSKVICPGISSNNYVIARAKVQVDTKYVSEK